MEKKAAAKRLARAKKAAEKPHSPNLKCGTRKPGPDPAKKVNPKKSGGRASPPKKE